MTEKAPKPIADCPNPGCHYDKMDTTSWNIGNNYCGITGRGYAVFCLKCGYHGPKTETTRDEAIRLHNLICRPQQSAEPDWWLVPTGYGLQVVKSSGGYKPASPDAIPLFAASPGPSELVERPNPETLAVAFNVPEVQHNDELMGKIFNITRSADSLDSSWLGKVRSAINEYIKGNSK